MGLSGQNERSGPAPRGNTTGINRQILDEMFETTFVLRTALDRSW